MTTTTDPEQLSILGLADDLVARAPDWRTSDPETSRAAALAIPIGRKIVDRERARQALERVGAHGATDFDLATLTGVGQTSIGKRRLELERAGVVARRLIPDVKTGELIGDRRTAPSGALAAVWVVAEFAHPADRP